MEDKIGLPESSDLELTPAEEREMLEEDSRRIRAELEQIRGRYAHPYDMTSEDQTRVEVLSKELDETLLAITRRNRREGVV